MLPGSYLRNHTSIEGMHRDLRSSVPSPCWRCALSGRNPAPPLSDRKRSCPALQTALLHGHIPHTGHEAFRQVRHERERYAPAQAVRKRHRSRCSKGLILFAPQYCCRNMPAAILRGLFTEEQDRIQCLLRIIDVRKFAKIRCRLMRHKVYAVNASCREKWKRKIGKLN